ncbi:MAG: hypothetical protein LBQ64_00110, partial [Bacteroidales bacterium]|jgi:heptosyltransferase-2|nr:hypothetical protein [Bacteroidales bacterium]
LSFISYKKLTGVFIDEMSGVIGYSEDSASWFDLSLASRFPKETADRMKYEATRSVQDYLYEMIGKTFSGEEYLIPEDIIPDPQPYLVGIEARAGARWETKRWNAYPQLAEKLERHGFNVRFFTQREYIKDYMRDIAQCCLVITGDTLAMHCALALKIPVVALFTCTSPSEIYDYQRMQKVISPCLWDAFYKTTYIPQAVESISEEVVWEAVEKAIHLYNKR